MRLSHFFTSVLTALLLRCHTELERKIVGARACFSLGTKFSVLQDEWMTGSNVSTAMGMTGRPFLGLTPLFSSV